MSVESRYDITQAMTHVWTFQPSVRPAKQQPKSSLQQSSNTSNQQDLADQIISAIQGAQVSWNPFDSPDMLNYFKPTISSLSSRNTSDSVNNSPSTDWSPFNSQVSWDIGYMDLTKYSCSHNKCLMYNGKCSSGATTNFSSTCSCSTNPNQNHFRVTSDSTNFTIDYPSSDNNNFHCISKKCAFTALSETSDILSEQPKIDSFSAPSVDSWNPFESQVECTLTKSCNDYFQNLEQCVFSYSESCTKPQSTLTSNFHSSQSKCVTPVKPNPSYLVSCWSFSKDSKSSFPENAVSPSSLEEDDFLIASEEHYQRWNLFHSTSSSNSFLSKKSISSDILANRQSQPECTSLPHHCLLSNPTPFSSATNYHCSPFLQTRSRYNKSTENTNANSSMSSYYNSSFDSFSSDCNTRTKHF